ncbi:MAG: surface carbohydrate biosynthesis protein, partial [Methanobacterium sp.]
MKNTVVSSRPWVIIPIETKARELHAKILLACIAAEKGWGVILGEATTIRDKQQYFPQGVFLEKSIHPGTEKLIKKSISYGNRVSAWCEEGLIYYGPDDYCERRLNIESFDMIDFFFAWGKNQADDITATLNRPKNKIVLTGNPRFDLLRKEVRGIFSTNAAKIRLKYGPII